MKHISTITIPFSICLALLITLSSAHAKKNTDEKKKPEPCEECYHSVAIADYFQGAEVIFIGKGIKSDVDPNSYAHFGKQGFDDQRYTHKVTMKVLTTLKGDAGSEITFHVKYASFCPYSDLYHPDELYVVQGHFVNGELQVEPCNGFLQYYSEHGRERVQQIMDVLAGRLYVGEGYHDGKYIHWIMVDGEFIITGHQQIKKRRQ